VGRDKAVGASSSFAPGDHAHDLSEGVVDRKHLGEDVYKNLVQGGSGVKVEGDPSSQTIRVSADVPAPGDSLKQLSSVTGTKRVGNSQRYAREDHAHDLRINGLSPNEGGDFLLTPGRNVKIEKGAADNALVISAEGGGTTVVASGVFVFENVLPQQVRASDLIPHGIESGPVAVIIAEEPSDGLRTRVTAGALNPVSNITRFGDATAFFEEAPFLMAEVDDGRRILRITLKDRRRFAQEPDAAVKVVDESNFRFAPAGETAPTRETDLSLTNEPSGIIAPTGVPEPSPEGGGVIAEPDTRNYRIRWWAIPGGEAQTLIAPARV